VQGEGHRGIIGGKKIARSLRSVNDARSMRSPAYQASRGQGCDRSARNDGAGGGSRTHTALRPTDFESAASAIPPLRLRCFRCADSCRQVSMPGLQGSSGSRDALRRHPTGTATYRGRNLLKNGLHSSGFAQIGDLEFAFRGVLGRAPQPPGVGLRPAKLNRSPPVVKLHRLFLRTGPASESSPALTHWC
jgi:hypothetical protein